MTDEVETGNETQAELSAMDRVANALGLKGPEPEPETVVEGVETEQAEDVADLEFEGLRFRVPAKAKDAFMRNEDYTKKTQALSEEKRALDAIREAVQQQQQAAGFAESVKTETQELAIIDAYLAQATKADWANMSTEQIMRAKIEIDSVKERRDAIRAAIQEKRSKFDDEFKAKIASLRSKSREVASKSIGGFSEQTEKSIRDHATQAFGFTDSEIDNATLDPRVMQVLWESMQYRRIKAGTKAVTDKTQPLLKPGAAGEKMPAEVAARLNLRKALKGAQTSGQKATVIEQRLANMFGKR